jgi:hypothetical protein
MDEQKTKLEMVQRYIAESEALVVEQRALLDELAQHDFDTARAEALLVSLKDKLRCLREELARFQEHAAGSSSPT